MGTLEDRKRQEFEERQKPARELRQEIRTHEQEQRDTDSDGATAEGKIYKRRAVNGRGRFLAGRFGTAGLSDKDALFGGPVALHAIAETLIEVSKKAGIISADSFPDLPQMAPEADMEEISNFSREEIEIDEESHAALSRLTALEATYLKSSFSGNYEAAERAQGEIQSLVTKYGLVVHPETKEYAIDSKNLDALRAGYGTDARLRTLPFLVYSRPGGMGTDDMRKMNIEIADVNNDEVVKVTPSEKAEAKAQPRPMLH